MRLLMGCLHRRKGIVPRAWGIGVTVGLVIATTFAPLAPSAAEPRPDLVVTKVSNPPWILFRGMSFGVTTEIKNRGGAGAPSSLERIYLSKDGDKSQDDVLLGSKETPGIDEGKDRVLRATLTVPNNTNADRYRVLACADARNQIRESGEGNNCNASSARVKVPDITFPRSRRPPPTSQSLIEDAVESGDISYARSLLYRAFALFWDRRLPAAYDGVGSLGEDTALFDEIRLVWADLTTAQQDLLEPFLARPTDPGSVFGPSSSVASGPAMRTAGGGAVNTGCPTDWINKSEPAGHFKVWLCPSQDAVVDQNLLTKVVGLGDGLWDQMAVAPPAGMGPPKPDSGGADAGGDTKIDVYILDTNQCRMRAGKCKQIKGDVVAKAVPAAPFTNNANGRRVSSGYILLGRDRAGSAELKEDFVHEFFHLLQFAHNLEALLSDTGIVIGNEKVFEKSWFVEASATWAEWIYAPTPPGELHRRFIKDFQPSRASLLDMTPDLHPYASYIWPFFVQQEHSKSPQPIFNAWVAIESAANPDGINDKLDNGFSFESHFRDFAVRNLNLDLDGDPLGKLYEEQQASFPTDHPPLISNRGIIKPGEPSKKDAEINSLAAQYDLFGVDPKVRYLKFDFSELGDDEVDVDVDAIAAIKDEWKRFKVEDDELEFCRDIPEEDVNTLYLVLSNHSREHPSAVEGSYEITAKRKCQARISGSITYNENSSSTGTGSEQENLDATIDVAMKSYDGPFPGFEDDGSSYTILYSRSSSGQSADCDYQGTWSGGGAGALRVDGGRLIEPGETSPTTGEPAETYELVVGVERGLVYSYSGSETYSGCDNPSNNITIPHPEAETYLEDVYEPCGGGLLEFKGPDETSTTLSLHCSRVEEGTSYTLDGTLTIGD